MSQKARSQKSVPSRQESEVQALTAVIARLPNEGVGHAANLAMKVQSNMTVRNNFRRCVRVLLLLTLSAVAGCAQNTAPAESTKRATSTPYTGDLSIFDSPGREQRLHIDRVMDILGIAAGKSIADIGAGSGWFTVRAARRVGPSGTVYAVDINPEAIRYLDGRVQKESLHNVKTILSKPDDPMLPKQTLDAVLLLKTYHEVDDPVALLEHLRPALRTGARLGIIDRNGNGTNHGVSREVVVNEAARAGYHLVQTYDFVKDDGMDYFLLFEVR